MSAHDTASKPSLSLKPTENSIHVQLLNYPDIYSYSKLIPRSLSHIWYAELIKIYLCLTMAVYLIKQLLLLTMNQWNLFSPIITSQYWPPMLIISWVNNTSFLIRGWHQQDVTYLSYLLSWQLQKLRKTFVSL